MKRRTATSSSTGDTASPGGPTNKKTLKISVSVSAVGQPKRGAAAAGGPAATAAAAGYIIPAMGPEAAPIEEAL